MSPAKIRLSATERELLCNKDWILTKNAILQKTGQLLIGMQQEVEAIVSGHHHLLPIAALDKPPKLSRGENYQGLPYLVLDYPRLFTREDVFAIRTLFWWGHFFSVTLHLGGRSAAMHLHALTGARNRAIAANLYAGVGKDEWEHHFEPTNYRPAAGFSQEGWAASLAEKQFIKLACRLPVAQWESAPGFMADSYRVLLGILQEDQLPKR